MTEPRTVACPHCGANVPWTPDSRWRPFCSARCKTIDLGAWASEVYRVPVREIAEGEEAGAPDSAPLPAAPRGE